MKRILILVFAIAFGTTLFAQNDSAMHKPMMHKKHMGMMKDCVMMKDGKMMMMKNGKTMMMEKDMTMKNGTMVMTDGTVKMKNNETKTMENGDCMMMDGTMKKMKMGKMKGDMDKMDKKM